MLNVQHSPVPELKLTAVFGEMVVSKQFPGSAESMSNDDGGSLKWFVTLVTQEGISPVIYSLFLWCKSGRSLYEMLK